MAKRQRVLTQGLLRVFMRYDVGTGKLYWRSRSIGYFANAGRCTAWNTAHAGKEAGGIDWRGYRICGVLGKTYMVHRLVWFYVYGEWVGDAVEFVIDHIDGDKSNNRIHNLRVVDRRESMKNLPLGRHNKTGCFGVQLVKGKYTARITVDYVPRHLGTFDTLEEAVAARKQAEKKYGFHRNHGRESIFNTYG